MVEQKEENKAQLTKEETEIYDRQIRLWGVEAQQRLVHIYWQYILTLILIFKGYVRYIFACYMSLKKEHF